LYWYFILQVGVSAFHSLIFALQLPSLLKLILYPFQV
jgi:hypothetical protein